MSERRYSKVLTIILIVIIIAIIGLLGFLGYNYFRNRALTNNASEYVDSFEKQIAEIEESPAGTESSNTTTETVPEIDGNSIIDNSSSGTKKKSTYMGFEVLGTIEIPKTNVKYPILSKLSKASLNTAVVAIYPREIKLNQPGNVVIAGHNYKNGAFFSNNKKLAVGDKIYITDLEGKKLTYTIYNKYETDENDTKSYNKDTNGKTEITLSTCTDNSKARIIIEARAE